MGSRGNTRIRSTVVYKLAGATATAGSKQLTKDVFMERNILIGMVTVIAFALFIIMPKACATQAANEQAAVELHKDSIRTTYISPADQAYIDFASDDFKQANQHANEFLRANRQNETK